ncbi:sulfotransferase family protein [uncultured Nocardioides sp.]|uniref:sulfotransferase family protein n=1 Tax=uncultured Nocardioides sp. TaxID=198441 RepID=UPI00260384E5|nr:sulfotransferase family protein [uncultured Nocardioides sp.]
MGEQNTVVLVTGSMRSGTSSLAGSLKLLGWHVPQPEVPASERNAKGHFEPRWVIEFHKRLMRGALIRPSDGSPRAEERVAALLEDGEVRRELAAWLSQQEQERVVIKDPHAAWVLPLWRAAAADSGRDLRILTALRHPAEVVGSQDRTWGEGRRTDAERKVKETSNTAAWLNLALVTERGSRGAPRAFIRYHDLLADWRTALGRVSGQLELGLSLDADHGLDEFLDPGMRRSQLTWDDIALPDWLREQAENVWQQLGVLVEAPDDGGVPSALDAERVAYDARYAEAVAISLDEARHRERRGSAKGAAKLRGRLRAERARRRELEARLAEAQVLSHPESRGLVDRAVHRLTRRDR